MQAIPAYSTGCLKHLPAADAFRQMRACGITRIELNPTLYIRGEESLTEIQAALDVQAGMSVSAILGGWCDFSVPTAQLPAQLASIERQAVLARALKVSRVRLFYGHISRQAADKALEESLVAALQTLADTHPDLCFAFETHDGINADPDWCAHILTQVGRTNIRAVFDPVNIVCAGLDPFAGYKVLSRHIVNTHMKDLANGHLVALGCGEFPWKKLLSAMQADGYAGSFTVEYEGKDAAQAGLSNSVLHANRLLQPFASR